VYLDCLQFLWLVRHSDLTLVWITQILHFSLKWKSDSSLGTEQVEELLKEFDNVCTLRVRMPITSDLQNPRNFITKISRYQKVVNIPNSMTILDELLPISIEMAKRNLRGIWNFTNPGVVSHNEILEMYREYIDPTFTWKNFTLEEQAKVIIAARSNNELDASKLQKEFPEMLPIKESLVKYVFEPNRQVYSK
jgi:dTDP-4-dehydrorhamnose reductase